MKWQEEWNDRGGSGMDVCRADEDKQEARRRRRRINKAESEKEARKRRDGRGRGATLGVMAVPYPRLLVAGAPIAPRCASRKLRSSLYRGMDFIERTRTDPLSRSTTRRSAWPLAPRHERAERPGELGNGERDTDLL